MCQFSDKKDNFEFLGLTLSKNGFWGRNFKSLSLDLESAPPKYHVGQFSIKMDNFYFFWTKFGEIVLLRAIISFKYCWECCRGLVGGWNELDGGGWSWVEVDGDEWSWVEVNGAGWSWVHGLVIPAQKSCSREDFFHKRVIFNKFYDFFWWTRKKARLLFTKY